MREHGLERCQLMLGIDFTASNDWQGRSTLKGQSLHHLSNKLNPYQHVISIISRTLDNFITEAPYSSKDGVIEIDYSKGVPTFGFGDTTTADHSVFSIHPKGVPCADFKEVQACYRQVAPSVVFGGPTSYAPVIRKAIEICEKTHCYHILVIIADGQFVTEGPTAR